MLTERRSKTPATRNGWRMNLDKFAGGELTRLIRKGINEILDNIRDEGTTPPGKANADRENNIPAGERSKEHEDPD